MTIAQGVRKVVAYKKEPGWAVPPGATGGKELARITGVGNLSKATFQSNEIARHMQVSGYRHGLRSAAYAFNGEMSAGKYVDLWTAMTRSAYAAAPTSGSLTNVTASAVAPHFVRTTGSWLTNGFRVGDVFRWSGWTSPATANNANNFMITALTATNMTVVALNGSAVVAKAAGNTVIATMAGKRTSVPEAVHTDGSYYFEDWYDDISQSEQFSGCKFQDATIQLGTGGIATVAINFLGKDMVPGISQYFTTPTEPSQSGKMAGINGVVLLNGAPVATATGLNLSINSNLSQAEVMGSKLSPAIFQGRVTASGQVTLYFEDIAMRDAFLNEQIVSIICAFTDSPSANANFVAFNLSNVKLGGAGKDDSEKGIIQTLPFTSYKANQGLAAVQDTTISIQDSMAFDPIEDMFRSLSGTGLWLDPLADHTRYLDTAGTALAVMDGAVARMDAVGGVSAQFSNATAVQQPLLRAAGLEFDGIDDGLSCPDNPALRFGTSSFTVAIAMRPDVVTGQHELLSKRGTGAMGTNPGWGLRQNTAAINLEYDYTGALTGPTYNVAPAVLSVATWTTVLVEIDVVAGLATARINGVAQTPVAITVGDISGTQPLVYGNDPTNTSKFDGILGRAIVIDKILSASDKQIVEQWIMAGYQ